MAKDRTVRETERQARLAAALRDNLRRRKAARNVPDAAPREAEAAGRPKPEPGDREG